MQDFADHLQGVKELFGTAKHRVDVAQAFGGEGGITKAALDRNMMALQVVARKYG